MPQASGWPILPFRERRDWTGKLPCVETLAGFGDIQGSSQSLGELCCITGREKQGPFGMSQPRRENHLLFRSASCVLNVCIALRTDLWSLLETWLFRDCLQSGMWLLTNLAFSFRVLLGHSGTDGRATAIHRYGSMIWIATPTTRTTPRDTD